MEIVVVILVLGVCSLLGYAVASDRNKGLGAVLGFLLGPIGILIAAVVK